MRRGLFVRGGALVALAVALIASGCSDQRDSAARSRDDRVEQRFGLVTVVLSEDLGDGARVTGSAQFVQARGVSRPELLQVLGATDYSELSDFEAGQCVVGRRSLAPRQPEDDGTRDADLLDAGDVTLHFTGAELRLAPQHFPDIVPYVTGVTYERSVPDVWGVAQTAGGLMRVRSTGSFDIAPMHVEIDVPRGLRIATVAGRRAGAQAARARYDRDLDLTWDPAGASTSLVFVEVQRYSFDAVASVRCLVPDTGAFAIPQESLAALPRLSGPTTDRLQVSRVSMQSFEAEGLDDGMVVFVAQDSVLLR